MPRSEAGAQPRARTFALRAGQAARIVLARPALLMVCGVFLALTTAYSTMTPAWESNDEADHVRYIELVAENGTMPPMEVNSGLQSHQPPLYYYVAAGWQKLLGIPAFVPDQKPSEVPVTFVPNRPTRALILSHDYDRQERQHAVYVHELRVLSILLGAATLLLTFAAGRLATGREDLALAATAFVALLPKFNVVSATVTNDALVITLASLALVLVLLYLRRPPQTTPRRVALAAGVGLVLGAAAVTKLSALPLVAPILLALLLARSRLVHRLADLGAAAGGFLAASGWYFVRNERLYGDPLAAQQARDYLEGGLPGLIDPVPWWDAERFLYFVPETLLQSSWYTGGWNQFYPPTGVTLALSFLAAIALFGALRGFFLAPVSDFLRERRIGAVLFAWVVAGLIAVLLVAKEAIQAQGRVTYVGLSAFAILATLGLAEASGGSPRVRRAALLMWPVVLALFNVYVLVRFVIPFRHL